LGAGDKGQRVGGQHGERLFGETRFNAGRFGPGGDQTCRSSCHTALRVPRVIDGRDFADGDR